MQTCLNVDSEKNIKYCTYCANLEGVGRPSIRYFSISYN